MWTFRFDAAVGALVGAPPDAVFDALFDAFFAAGFSVERCAAAQSPAAQWAAIQINAIKNAGGFERNPDDFENCMEDGGG